MFGSFYLGDGGIMLKDQVIDVIYDIMYLQEIIMDNHARLNHKFIKEYLEQKKIIITKLTNIANELKKIEK